MMWAFRRTRSKDDSACWLATGVLPKEELCHIRRVLTGWAVDRPAVATVCASPRWLR